MEHAENLVATARVPNVVAGMAPRQVLQYLLQFDPSMGGISCRLMSLDVARRMAEYHGKHLKGRGKR